MEKLATPTLGRQPAVKRKPSKLVRMKWEYFVMILPGLIVLFINNYIPMTGILIAFKRYMMKGNYFENIILSPLPNIHGTPNLFGNFFYLFTGPSAWTITRNTIGYNLIFIVLGTVIAIAFALILSELRNRRTSKIYQSVMFLPYFLSWVVVGYLAYAFFSPNFGFINKSILGPLGLLTHQDPTTGQMVTADIQYYSQTIYWPFILIFFNIWKYAGYNCVVYLASITAIDPEFYEAAMIDGANRWQRIKHITLPQLQPLIIILTVLAIGRIFNSDFGLFYQVPRNQGPLYAVTDTIDTYVFRALRQDSNIGMATAAGLYQSVVGFVLVILANTLVKKIDRDKAVF